MFTMQATADALEARIRAHRPLTLGVPWENELVYANYDGLSLRNVAHTLAELLGVRLPHHAPLDEALWGGVALAGRVQRVVGVLTDGLGYLTLRDIASAEAEVADLLAEITEGRGPLPLTSVSPSTTAVALPALWSGASPAATGMLGTLMFLREFSQMGDMLSYGPVGAWTNRALGTFDRFAPPQDFIAVRGLAQWLEEVGVPTHLVVWYQYANIGLSRFLHRGVRHIHPHYDYGDFWQRLGDVLAATRGQRAYIAAYIGAVDALSHAYGADNRYVRREVLRQLRDLRDLLRDPNIADGQTLFFVTADHGHGNAPHKIDLRNDPKAAYTRSAMRVGPGGDNRFTYLYLREGTREQVRAELTNHFGEVLAVVDSATALSAGVLGTEPPAPETEARIGDLILLPQFGYEVSDPNVVDLKMTSYHAGLHEREMLTPLLWRLL